MKKICLLCFAFLLLFSLPGCKHEPMPPEQTATSETIEVPEENPSATELHSLQKKIQADEKLIGVAYLGWLEGDMATACKDLTALDYMQDFPFVADVEHYAEHEGYRMYLIVPTDDNVTVTVSTCAFDEEYMPYGGEELAKANAPILVRGNMSDTIPNLYVVAQKGEKQIEYTPVQSGMDGRLENSKNKVYDFTPYDQMPEFMGADRVPDAVFCGEWIAFSNDGNEEERTLTLSINPDGSAFYAYGIGNSEVLEQFEGTWQLDENDILSFELLGGQPESIENPVVTNPYDCNPSFAWEMTSEGLWLTHIDGDEILYGTKGSTFLFVSNEQ